jgi:hypothetical protein
VNYQRLSYVTYDRSLEVDFVFWDCGAALGWRVYIITPINYGIRNTSGHATHRLHYRGDTYPCICWAGRIATLEQAKAVASLWTDATALYIRHGGSFDRFLSGLLKR